MESWERCFLLLLRDAMRSRSPSDQGAEAAKSLSFEEAEAMLHLAQLQNVLPLVGGHFLQAVPDYAQAQQLRGVLRRQVVRQSLCSAELLELTQALEAANVPYFLVKGAFCRSLYPEPDLRPSSDEDILVKPEAYAAAETVLRAHGFSLREALSGEQVHTWQGRLLHVELHRHLLAEGKIRTLTERAFFGPNFPIGAQFSYQGHKMSTLRPQEHFLFLIAHLYGHFLAGGVGIRQLCDIVRTAEAYQNALDWGEIWPTLREISLEVFFASLLKIAVEFLGLVEDAVPFPDGLTLPDPGPLLSDLLGAGVFGSSTLERKQSSHMTIEAAKTGRRSSLLAAAFPPAKALEGRYPYLRKHPWLAPLAWGSRAARYFSKGNAAFRAGESTRIGNQRVALLEYYGILSMKEESN